MMQVAKEHKEGERFGIKYIYTVYHNYVFLFKEN